MAGPPDQLLCDPADNGGFLISGVCELPDAVIGLPYQGHLITSHKAGGTLSVVSGSLPPGLSLPAAFAGSGDTIGGTPTTPASNPTTPSPCKAPATRASPCTRSTRSWLTRTSRWPSPCRAVGSTLSPGMVGGAYAQDFFLSGGAGPYTWSLASGQLPPGLTLQTFASPRDANDELAGTPTTAGHLRLHHAAGPTTPASRQPSSSPSPSTRRAERRPRPGKHVNEQALPGSGPAGRRRVVACQYSGRHARTPGRDPRRVTAGLLLGDPDERVDDERYRG